MSRFPSLLIIDCYDSAGMQTLARAGASKAGLLYKKMLGAYTSEESMDIVEISADTAPDIDLDRYDGVCWTGSNLFFSAANDIVQRHIDTCRALFDNGTPQFGSCWAAQLAAVVAGGTCEKNPRGREFGVSRKITLNNAGREHPMYADKPAAFDGFTSHADIVSELPAGAILLASNSFAAVQALDVQLGNGSFWAVQYHPEYDCAEVAALSVARRDELISQGSLRDTDAANTYTNDLNTLHETPERRDLAWKLGIDEDVLDPAVRTLEARNWLRHFFNI
ncbi:MAG: type 1 glutamine amidotransferase [Pseudomonadota bacterium]